MKRSFPSLGVTMKLCAILLSGEVGSVMNVRLVHLFPGGRVYEEGIPKIYVDREKMLWTCENPDGHDSEFVPIGQPDSGRFEFNHVTMVIDLDNPEHLTNARDRISRATLRHLEIASQHT